MFKSPAEIAFSIGTIDVYYYGIIMAAAILLGILTILAIKKRFFPDISSDKIFDISFLLIIWGIIGARLYYVILDYKYFMKFPLEIPAVWHGGISVQGAIIAGIIAGIFYVKKHNINFFKHADLFIFGLLTGQIIGRWGNFFNSEAFGLPTDLPWKLYIPYNNRPLEFRSYEFFHPAFLYESILNIIVFMVLYTILAKCKTRKDGLIFFMYMILYSIVRILVETIRIDSVLDIAGIHVAHIASLIFIIIGITGIYILHIRTKSGIGS